MIRVHVICLPLNKTRSKHIKTQPSRLQLSRVKLKDTWCHSERCWREAKQPRRGNEKLSQTIHGQRSYVTEDVILYPAGNRNQRSENETSFSKPFSPLVRFSSCTLYSVSPFRCFLSFVSLQFTANLAFVRMRASDRQCQDQANKRPHKSKAAPRVG